MRSYFRSEYCFNAFLFYKKAEEWSSFIMACIRIYNINNRRTSYFFLIILAYLPNLKLYKYLGSWLLSTFKPTIIFFCHNYVAHEKILKTSKCITQYSIAKFFHRHLLKVLHKLKAYWPALINSYVKFSNYSTYLLYLTKLFFIYYRLG